MITKTLSDMLEAAEQAADWLCDASPNTDQWERGTRLRKAMHAFRKSQKQPEWLSQALNEGDGTYKP